MVEPVELEAFLARLSREPDFDAPELRAYDAADLLLLEMAGSLVEQDPRPLVERRSGKTESCIGVETNHSTQVLTPGTLVTIGDRHGALTLGAAQLLGARAIRVHQDALLSERALDANAVRLHSCGTPSSQHAPQARWAVPAVEPVETGPPSYEHHPLGRSLLEGATLVLMQLPRSLAELEEIAWNIAEHAHPDVTVLAGGRDKHMSRGMNEVFSRCFGEVAASRGWRKARVLTARGPDGRVPQRPPFPVWGEDPELSFRLAAFGATFGGATLDHGSRLLLRTLGTHPVGAHSQRGSQDPPSEAAAKPRPGAAEGHAVRKAMLSSRRLDPSRIVDIGCGNGVLAVSAALAWPTARILATDQSAAAVAATRLTAEAAGVADRVEVHRADGAEAVPDGWADLVLLNPPFHSGSTVHAGVGHRLIRSSARALAPGGELRLVFNSHLGYRPLVKQAIGPTEQLARDSTFTVLAATRR